MGPDGNASAASIAIGPLSNFKLATSVISTRNGSSDRGGESGGSASDRTRVWEMGLSSEVRSVNAAFTHRTLIVYGEGPTRAMQRCVI